MRRLGLVGRMNFKLVKVSDIYGKNKKACIDRAVRMRVGS